MRPEIIAIVIIVALGFMNIVVILSIGAVNIQNKKAAQKIDRILWLVEKMAMPYLDTEGDEK